MLRTLQNVDVVEKCGGGYKYLGLANGITRVLSAGKYESDQTDSIVNTDGIPVFKSSNTVVANLVYFWWVLSFSCGCFFW